ncbi:MAG: carbohydrate ABC transporter permease, partial [Clostridia bacterium]|nr:carbohydrate ABC transporter permease [Clostridia bacterium]
MEEKKIDQQVAPQVVEDVQDIDSKIAFGTNSLVDKAMDESAVMTERKIEQVKKRQRVAKVIGQVGVYVFLIAMALIVLFPFYWMIISSLKTKDEYYLTTPTFWPTQGWDFANYAQAFKVGNLGVTFANTVYVGIVSTALSLVITVLSAFALARLEFKGKNLLFAGMLATMMIPGELFTITNYKTVVDIGWTNTFTVLIVPFLVSVFYIYLLRQNFMQIPDELYYAAKVDGTSDLKYLWKVMIPIAMPSLISITILKMMGAWNSYVWPRLVASDDVHALITYKLRT